MSTQPSEFEQMVEQEFEHLGADCAVSKHSILTAHNASIAAAERRSVLDNLELLQEQVGASHALHGDGPEFTKWLSGKFQREIAAYRRALSGQEPTDWPLTLCGSCNCMTRTNPVGFCGKCGADKAGRSDPPAQTIYTDGAEPAKPCKTCDGSGIDPEHPHQSKMCKCIKPPCPDCGGTGVVK